MMSVDLTARDTRQEMLVFRAVDEAGREWQVDPDAWSPLYPQNLTAWMNVVGSRRPALERDEAMRYLLRRADEARRRRVAGDRYIGNSAVLGPLAAPDIDLLPAAAPSPLRYRALRLYMQSWLPSEFVRDRSRVTSRLIAEVHE
jgi:hypothetical protein